MLKYFTAKRWLSLKLKYLDFPKKRGSTCLFSMPIVYGELSYCVRGVSVQLKTLPYGRQVRYF
jgi:hypothetical protein